MDTIYLRGSLGQTPARTGLAIVRDLAELYGGSISLGHSTLGGVRARLQLPSA